MGHLHQGLKPLPTFAAVALAIALAGCGPGAAPAERPPVRIALHADPSSLDPHLQSESVAQSVLGNVYESLVTFDVDLGLKPSLAERWDNPDDRVWRFYLRPGVRFHDGRPLTTGDVVASLERARSHPESKSAGALVAIEEVRAVDPRIVEIRTATPYPILLNKLVFFYVLPAGGGEGTAAEISHPIGTGPYRLAAYLPAEERLRLRAFDEHWRGPPPAERVEYRFVADPEERVRLLLAGEVELINELPPEAVAAVSSDPRFRVAARSSLSVTYIQMNVAVPPFDDPRVRRAIDLALDRQALVDHTLHGQGQPVGQMVSPDVFGYAPDLEAATRDLAAARRLLAESGHPDGLELTLEHRAGREVEPIREQLAEAGIRVTAVARPWSEMYPRLQSGEVPFYFGSWVCNTGDASDLLDQKVHSQDLDSGYGASNSNRYSNPELDRLIEEIGNRLDMMQRRGLLQRALRRLAEERAFLPLFTPFELYGVSRGVAWTPRQDERVYGFEVRRE